MATLVVMVVPTILHLFSKLITDSAKLDVTLLFLTGPMLFVSFPVIALFLDVIFRIFVSFFRDLWKNLNIHYIFELIKKRIDGGNYTKCQIFWRISMYLVLFYLLAFLIFSELIQSSIALSGFIMMIIGLYPVMKGLISVFLTAWKNFLQVGPQTTNDEESLEADNDGSDVEDHGLIPHELLDPSNLSNQDHWKQFIKDPECNHFLYRNYPEDKRIFGKITMFLNCIIVFISLLVSIPRGNYFGLILPLLIVLVFPFTIIVNFSVLGYPSSRFERRKGIYISLMVTISLYIIVFIILAFFLISIRQWKPVVIDSLNYVNMSSTNFTVLNNHPAHCRSSIPGSLSIIQLSGLSTLPRLFQPLVGKSNIKPGNEEIFNNTMKYLFGENYFNDPFEIESLHESTSVLAFTRKNITYISIGGIENPVDWCIFLESYLSISIPILLSVIIPFFSLLYQVAPVPIMVAMNLISFMFYLVPVSHGVSESIGQYISNRYSLTGSYPVIVGQNIGGYIAKELSKTYPIHGFAYDGIKGVMTWNDLKFIQNTAGYKSKGMVTNIYTESSIFGSFDNNLKFNIMYPNIHKDWFPYNVYEAFCLSVVQCATDDTYYPMCQQLLSLNGKNGTGILSDMFNLF